MLRWLLSDDLPRSRVLAALLAAVVLCLALAPFLFPGTRSLETAARICVFILLVASYDLLIGYVGVVSFAHTMFFGLGAYGVAITTEALGASWGALLLGTIAGLAVAVVLALLIGLLSLRVRAIFFAMVTLAVASAFMILVSQLYTFTGGEDGLTYKIPRVLTPAFRLVDGDVLGTKINGRLLAYYLVFFGAAALFLVLLRIVNSPFGRVLQAVRENEFRAEAIGFRTVRYRTAAVCLSAGFASLAGSLMAVWLRYVGPDTFLSMSIMLDVLVIVVIGGMGTMWGAVIGATLFILAQNYLQALMGTAADAVAPVPVLSSLVHPDRWLLWLGLLFILSVYHFPSGIVGRMRGAGGS